MKTLVLSWVSSRTSDKWNESMSEICEIFIKGFVTFCVTAGAARLGIYYFFKQKEYEIVKSRYLDASTDLLLVELENGLNIVSYNYVRTLNLVKDFRDHGNKFDLSKLEKGFVEIGTPKFCIVANHRLQLLCGSNIIWEAYQLALVYFADAQIKLTHEIINVIRRYEEKDKGLIGKDRITLSDFMLTEAKTIHEESYKYSRLTHQIQIISDLLEQNEMTFKQIEKFQKKPGIVRVVQNIKDEFLDEIEDANPHQESARAVS